MQLEINYNPNPKQRMFHESDADEVVYGGAKGGGKSHALVMECLAYCLENKGANAYLFRESYDALEANLIDKWKEVCPPELYKYSAGSHCVRMVNGSKVWFRFVTNKDDAMKHNGKSIDFLGVDELTFYEKDWIEILMSCVRSVKGFHPVFRGTCNPGGRGHTWVKERYVDGTCYGKKIVKDKISEKTIQFIPATVRDNTVLMEADPAYVKRLENLPEAQREAYLNGNWDIFEGQYFTEWDRDVHVRNPFDIPREWTRYVAMDYGRDMFACYDIAVDNNEQAYVINEIYESGLLVSEAAARIHERFKSPIFAYIAPPDLWNKHADTGRSTAEIFASYGIYLSKAKNDRVQGWSDLREWLKPYEDEQGIKRAKLQIFSNCSNLIRCLPMLQFDDKNPNDCAKNPHEITHAPDAIRYFVAGRPTNVPKIENNFEYIGENEIYDFCEYGT